MILYDTQIVSYDIKGSSRRICYDGYISSITGLEFLKVQGDQPTKARYYIPIGSRIPGYSAALAAPRDHPFQKNSTDQVLLDFGGYERNFIEFCNVALTDAINSARPEVFVAAIHFQEKNERKLLKKRFGYLIERRIQSVPLSPAIIRRGFRLLGAFLDQNTPKNDFRNTVNDMLILATALELDAPLVTEDSLLLRFAVDYAGCTLHSDGLFVRMQPPSRDHRLRKPSSESKGYINRGWTFKIRK
jgi:hypothetical protein